MHEVAKAPAGALELQLVSKNHEDDQNDTLEKKDPSPAPVRYDHSTKYGAEDAGLGGDRGDDSHVLANLLQRDHFRSNNRHH